METKEQLLYFFLQGKISLSQYDYKFMANLQTIIHNENRVTSNQADLFNRLVVKYKKQLAKNEIDESVAISLPWKSFFVESTPEYTGATVNILDDEITIRVPFNKVFISKFREIKNNPFNWNKERKIYTSSFCTEALKIATTELHMYFSTVQYCGVIQKILEDLKQYEAEIWDPTLKLVNGKLIVAAITPALADAIGDLQLNLEPTTLYKLSQYGVNIDPTIVQNDQFLKFASERTTQVDASEISEVCDMIKKLGCNTVLWGRGLAHGKLGKEIRKAFSDSGITVYDKVSYSSEKYEDVPMCISIYENYDNPISSKVGKMITVKDSRPIEIK